VSRWCTSDGLPPGATEGAEGSKPSAEAARRQQKQHAIVRSEFELGGGRKFTWNLVHLFANMRLPVLRSKCAARTPPQRSR
jgi:hypothetical protein